MLHKRIYSPVYGKNVCLLIEYEKYLSGVFLCRMGKNENPSVNVKNSETEEGTDAETTGGNGGDIGWILRVQKACGREC